jgi:hypothetical protein
MFSHQVRVLAEREPDVAVTQPGRHRLDVLAAADGDRSVRVTQVVEPDATNLGKLDQLDEALRHGIGFQTVTDPRLLRHDALASTLRLTST